MVDRRPRIEGELKDSPAERTSHRMPSNSHFYERIIPALLLLMGIVAAALILFAVGVLLGFVPFQ